MTQLETVDVLRVEMGIKLSLNAVAVTPLEMTHMPFIGHQMENANVKLI